MGAERRVHVAGFGIEVEDLHVATVQDRRPYGLSLDQLQFASTIGRLAARVLPAWEAYDIGT